MLAVAAGAALFGGAMWALIVIALDVLVIWALIVHGGELAAERRS